MVYGPCFIKGNRTKKAAAGHRERAENQHKGNNSKGLLHFHNHVKCISIFRGNTTTQLHCMLISTIVLLYYVKKQKGLKLIQPTLNIQLYMDWKNQREDKPCMDDRDSHFAKFAIPRATWERTSGCPHLTIPSKAFIPPSDLSFLCSLSARHRKSMGYWRKRKSMKINENHSINPI